MIPTLRKKLRQELDRLKLLEETAANFAIKIASPSMNELRELALEAGESDLAAVCRKPMPLSARVEKLSAFLVGKPNEKAANGPLTVAQAAERFSVSERTIYRMIQEGLPHIKVRGAIRIKPAVLSKYLERQADREWESSLD